jgi:hypothetical protein
LRARTKERLIKFLLSSRFQDENKGPVKPIDLDRLFTPATDAEEIVPGKNSKWDWAKRFLSLHLSS